MFDAILKDPEVSIFWIVPYTTNSSNAKPSVNKCQALEKKSDQLLRSENEDKVACIPCGIRYYFMQH